MIKRFVIVIPRLSLYCLIASRNCEIHVKHKYLNQGIKLDTNNTGLHITGEQGRLFVVEVEEPHFSIKLRVKDYSEPTKTNHTNP